MRLIMVLALLIVGNLIAQNKEKPKGDVPKPLYSMTLAIEPGKPTKMTIRGRQLDTVTALRIQEPKSTGKLLGKGRKVGVGNQQSADIVGDTEIDIEITASKETPGGVIPIAFANEVGESKPCFVAIQDDTPRVSEKEPNDSFKEAQTVAKHVVIDGGFKGAQDVDVYQFTVNAGDELAFRIQAKRLGSPAEPLLSVLNSQFRVVMAGKQSADDPDANVIIKFERAGTYFVNVLEANDQGGSNFNYRLSIQPTK